MTNHLSNKLFIGSFLSNTKGSLSVSENVAKWLAPKVGNIKLVSYRQNKIARLLDIAFNILFFRGNEIQIEVYSGSAFYIAYLSVLLAKLRNKNVLLNLHGGKLPEYTETKKKMVITTLQKANKIISPSKYLIDYYSKYHLEIEYIPNPFDSSNFAYNRSNIEEYSILWVRAFDETYQPEFAITILSLVLKEYPQAKLTMVGPDNGKLKETLETIKKLGLQNKVVITGPIANNKLSSYYQTHHVYINTTLYESFGISLIEAASCGIPIVSNPVGEIPYLWKHELTALLPQKNNAADFSQKIGQVFSSKEFADSLSKNAYAETTQFHWKVIEKKWLNLFNS